MFCKKAVRDEYEKLVIAIENARKEAMTDSSLAVLDRLYARSGIGDDYTFCKNRSVINCAEIWSVREMILHGAKYEDIKFGTRYFVPGDNFGSLFYPCENCEHVFKSIKNNVDGYGLR